MAIAALLLLATGWRVHRLGVVMVKHCVQTYLWLNPMLPVDLQSARYPGFEPGVLAGSCGNVASNQ